MRIVSFGYTADALLSGRKTVTRRKWKGDWLKVGDEAQAWDKGPHRGGKRVGTIKVLSVQAETWPLALERDAEAEARREGFMSPAEWAQVSAKSGLKEGDRIVRLEFAFTPAPTPESAR